MDKNGYLWVQLLIKGKLYHLSIHRLVAFLGYNPEKEVNHKNEIKNDSRLENLEWLSHQDNIIYSLPLKPPKIIKRPTSQKILDEGRITKKSQVCFINGKKFNSLAAAFRFLNLSYAVRTKELLIKKGILSLIERY